jgi:hypothetical protein
MLGRPETNKLIKKKKKVWSRKSLKVFILPYNLRTKCLSPETFPLKGLGHEMDCNFDTMNRKTLA